MNFPADIGPARRQLCNGRFTLQRWSGPLTGTIRPRFGRPLWLLPVEGEIVVDGTSAVPGEALLVGSAGNAAAITIAGQLLAACPGGDAIEGLTGLAERLPTAAIAA